LRKTNLVIDVSPNLFERVVGTNVIEAMILAKLGKERDEISDDDFEEIIDELDLRPRLLHPTGQLPQHQALRLRDPPLEPEADQEGPAHPPSQRPAR
jgi:hypothetical protein